MLKALQTYPPEIMKCIYQFILFFDLLHLILRLVLQMTLHLVLHLKSESSATTK